MISLVRKYLSISKFSNLISDFEDFFLSHPNYPSVYAITDSLDALSIENIAVKVPKEQLTQLPDVFLAFYDDHMVLVDKDVASVKITAGLGDHKTITYNAFFESWNGVVIAIEPNTEENSAVQKRNRKGLLYIFPFFALFVFSVVFHAYSWYSMLLLMTSLIGLMVSVFIIQEQLGYKNEITSKFCNSSPNASCDSVIRSGKSKMNEWIDFSDLPLVFFGISVLSILLQPKSSGIIVGFLSVLSIPVIAYSIGLQKFELKKWCALCLAVSFIVVLQSLVFSFTTTPFAAILSVSLFEFLFSLVLITSIWLFVKPILKVKINVEKEVYVFKKFKRNYSIFDFMSKEMVSINKFHQLKGLHFGNGDASANLTLILSPSCGHCHKAFEEAFELVSKFPERVSLNVLFNVNPENNDNPYKTVVESLLAINNTTPEKTAEAISDWHSKKMELEAWKEKWSIDSIDMKVNHQIYQQYNWCLENGFNYTPVKIVNEKLFPNEYDISELKYFLNDFSKENKASVRA